MFNFRQFIDFLCNVCYNYRMIQSSYRRATDRTRRKIRKAFAELLAERGAVKNFTVTDLADKADITRGTFYNYYNNLYEVGAELQADLEKQIFAEYNQFSSPEDVEQYVDQVFSYLERQESVYRQLLSSDAPSAFLNQLENEVSMRVLDMMHARGIKDKGVEFEVLLTASGAFSIVRKYFRNEIAVSLDDIRDYLKSKLHTMFDFFLN